MKLRYLLGALISFPLLPIMAIQGKRIRKKIPFLPPAEGPEGIAGSGSGSETLKLLTLGESTIACLGAKTHEEGLTGSLAREIAAFSDTKVEWKVYAKAGYTADLVRKQLVPKMKGESAEILIIGLGGNDAFTLNRPWRWKKHMDQLILSLREIFPDTPILFLNMPPIKEFPAFTSLIQFVVGNLVNILGHELSELVQQYPGVYYSSEEITLAGWMKKYDKKGQREDFFSDGVHPALVTYQVWAKDAARYIEAQQLLTSQQAPQP